MHLGDARGACAGEYDVLWEGQSERANRGRGIEEEKRVIESGLVSRNPVGWEGIGGRSGGGWG